MAIFKMFLMLMAPEVDPSGGGAPPNPFVHNPNPSPVIPEFSSLIPEAYKDRPYLKTISSVDDFFKQFDNAQTSLGKKYLPPPADASDDDYNKFLEALRPKDLAGYEFDKVQFPEGFGRNEEQDKAMRQMLFDAGLSPKQAKALMNKYDANLLEQINSQIKTKQEADEAYDKEFDEIASKTFGSKKDEALNNAKALIAEHMPKEFQTHLDKIGNNEMVMLASVLNAIKSKYIDEDGHGGGGGGGGAPTAAEKRAEAMKLMETPEYNDALHPGHDAMVAKVNALYS